MPVKYTAEDFRRWVDAIKDEASDKLNDWELNFIDSIDRQLGAGRDLSERQIEKLETIYAEKTS